jgi:CheY-like chemotaxis protein
MVYGFVKQSKGHIRIDSELGRGTTVNLYLPRTLEGEAAARPIDETKTERGNGETILVVEDEDGVRASVASQLVELGYRVVTVENGEKALKVLAGGKRFDLLFTDVVMPGGLNGRGLADEARMLDPALRVLYTSGYSESVITHQDRLDEGVDLLSKPYRRTQLAHAIRSALSSSTAAHAAPIITQKETPSSRNIAGYQDTPLTPVSEDERRSPSRSAQSCC